MRETVVVNDRWGQGTGCLHGGFFNCEDRYNPGVLLPHKWENAFTLDKRSWGQRSDITLTDIVSNEELIYQIVSTVSCNGNVLINIGPNRFGTVPLIFRERLNEMGKWLEMNGEAIYGTRPWLQQNDTLQPDVWYTTRSIKTDQFYEEQDSNTIVIYAIVLAYPYETNSIILKPWPSEMEDGAVIQEYRDEKVNLVGLDLNSGVWKRSIMSIKMLGLSRQDNDIKVINCLFFLLQFFLVEFYLFYLFYFQLKLGCLLGNEM